MNWTGGQLQRHSSARPGTLTKVQRQNFAKSRLNTSKGLMAGGGSSPFPRWIGTGRLSKDDRTDVKAEPDAGLKTTTPDTPQLETESSNRDNRLDVIKRRLLNESDWANLSAVRPLNIAFTSSAETENFGKRRKLNENDRNRMRSAGNSGLLFKPMFWQQMDGHPSSDMDLGEPIQIRINGRPVGPPSSDSRPAPINDSSQSMLLGHEEPGPTAHLREDRENNIQTNSWINTQRLSLKSTHGPVPSSYRRPDSESPVAPRTACSAAYPSSQPRDLQYFVGHLSAGSQSKDKPNESGPQTRACRMASDTPELPVRRHFTIDDQILPESMRAGGCMQPRQPDTQQSTSGRRSTSAAETQVQVKRDFETESLSGSGIPCWIQTSPHSFHQPAQPDSPRLCPLGLARRDEYVARVQPSSGSRFSRGGPITKADTTPVKVYGQPVCLAGDFIAGHDVVLQSLVWARNPPRVYGQPLSLISSSPDHLLEKHASCAD